MNTPLGILGAIWGTSYFVNVHHISALEASSVVSMIFLGTIVGAPSVGWISDKIGYRKKPMLVGTGLALLIILFVITHPELGLTPLLGLFFLLGLFTSTQVLSYPTIAESNPALLTATAVSVVSLTTQGGSALLQPLFGKLLDKGWDGTVVNSMPVYSGEQYQLAIMLIPAAFLVALVVAGLFLKETHCKPYVESP